MNEETRKIEQKFEAYFAGWEKVIRDPNIQRSSRPQDYINNEPYREIVKLGKAALPLIMKKLEQGVFFLNQAVVDITGIKMEEIIGKENRFVGERVKSKLILNWWKAQAK
jgi:hypothetical protein